MRRLRLLEEYLGKLSSIGAYLNQADTHLSIVLHLKRLALLSRGFYPQYTKHNRRVDFWLDEYGQIRDGYSCVDDVGDLMDHFVLASSDVTDYLLVYFENSPFWEVSFDQVCFSEYYNEMEMSMYEMMQNHQGCLETALIESLKENDPKHPLRKYYELFEDTDGCAADDCVILASKLLPYYKRNKRKLKKSDRSLCALIELGESYLTSWLEGESLSIWEKSLKKSYYISCDNSSYYLNNGYGYGNGAMDHDLGILVAGEVIDRGVLLLNKMHPFLPKELVMEGDLEVSL